jgi:hypothetical protein
LNFSAISGRSIVNCMLLFLFFIVSLPSKSQTLTKFYLEKETPDGLVFTYEGLKNETDEIIIPANYDFIWNFRNDSLTLARKRIWNPIEKTTELSFQIISKSGFLYFEFPYYLIPEPNNEGLFRCFNTKTNKWGFVDGFGNNIIKYKYVEALDFQEGLAVVKDEISLLYGYINKKGNFIIKPAYSEAFSFSEGKAIVKNSASADTYSFLNKNGSQVPIKESYKRVYNLENGFAIVEKSNADTILYGFIDSTGKEILSPKFQFIDNFENGTAVFLQNNEAGMLNSKGEIIIPARYDELYRFDQQHYLYQKNGLKGLINLDGKTIVPAKYSLIDYFNEGLSAVLKFDKWGFVDAAGNEVISCKYAEVKNGFVNGVVEVRTQDKWLIESAKDTIVLPPYDEVLPFYGKAAAFRIGNLWGFLNDHGEESIEPKFVELVFNKGGDIFGRIPLDDGLSHWVLIGNNGEFLTTNVYNEIVRFTEGFAAVKNEKGWGFIDVNGLEIVSPKYDAVRNFSNGRAAVMKNDLWGFINTSGHEVIPIYNGNPSFEDEEVAPNDTLFHIRESYPLYGMIVLGDFFENCACIQDEFASDTQNGNLCINKIGKLQYNNDCKPFTKIADYFDPKLEININLRIVRIPGKWMKIDKSGKSVE